MKFRSRKLLSIPFILFSSACIAIFIFKTRINDVYDTTIKQIYFKDILLEKDSLSLNNFTNLSKIERLDTSSQINNIDSTTSVAFNTIENKFVKSTLEIDPKLHGKEIKARDLKQLHQYNSRIRLNAFFDQFQDGDYMTGFEFSNLYRRDPTINKLTKSTICGFIEKNIRILVKTKNTFTIETLDTAGIHTKIKIPFVEDLRINISNGAKIHIGKTFTSTEKIFNKSVLLPIQLEGINILHNRQKFPISGYVSGDYYFINYSKSKMAYKLR
ncbi:hypothetical protein [uncultured Cytophaga sp.]|uniref:hypothetical protein n=1 Tax=uncultured Cytophaga sp. TaxID=160238 RepID=UPI002628838E|nr:hypothetical protein [uncultured Cytophaga sp.]